MRLGAPNRYMRLHALHALDPLHALHAIRRPPSGFGCGGRRTQLLPRPSQVWLMGREHADTMLSMYTDWLETRPSLCSRLTRAGATPAPPADFLQVTAPSLSGDGANRPKPIPTARARTPSMLHAIGVSCAEQPTPPTAARRRASSSFASVSACCTACPTTSTRPRNCPRWIPSTSCSRALTRSGVFASPRSTRMAACPKSIRRGSTRWIAAESEPSLAPDARLLVVH